MNTYMLLNQLTYQLAIIILWFLSNDFFLIVDSFQSFPGLSALPSRNLTLSIVVGLWFWLVLALF